MRILAITSLYPRPGREWHAPYNRQQFQALAAEHELVIVAPRPWTDGLRLRRGGGPAVEPAGVASQVHTSRPLYYYPPGVLHHLHGACYLASISRTVGRLLDAFCPEVVLSSWAHPDGWAAVRLAQRAGLPCVIKVPGSDVLVVTRRARRRRRVAEALTGADAVVAVSHDLAEHVIRLGTDPDRVHVVHEGVDPALFCPGDRTAARARLGLPPGEKIILFVGNLVLSKGAGVLVEAWRILAGRGQSFHGYLVGQGRNEARLRAQVARYGLGDRVTLAGARPHADLPDWYRACDLVALPSFSEGIPNVLREAMACGRPFVATRVGGIPEIADPAVCSLVAPGSATELADAIARLLAASPAEAEVLERARHQSWEQSARSLAAVLAAQCPRPAPLVPLGSG